MNAMGPCVRVTLCAAALWAIALPSGGFTSPEVDRAVTDRPAAATDGTLDQDRTTEQWRVVAAPDSQVVADLSGRVGTHRVQVVCPSGVVEVRSVSFTNVGLSGVLYQKGSGAADSTLSFGWSDVHGIVVRYTSGMSGFQKGVVTGATPGASMIGEGLAADNSFGGAIMMFCGAVLAVAGGVVGGIIGATIGAGMGDWRTEYVAPEVTMYDEMLPRTIAMVRNTKKDTRWDRAMRNALGRELEQLGYRVVGTDSIRRVLRDALGKKEASQAEQRAPSDDVLRLIRDRTTAEAVLTVDAGPIGPKSLDGGWYKGEEGMLYSLSLVATTTARPVMTATVFVPPQRKDHPARVAEYLVTSALRYLGKERQEVLPEETPAFPEAG